MPVINSASYSLSLVLLLSTFMRRSRSRWVVVYIALLSVDLILSGTIQYQTTILLAPISAAVLWNKVNGKEAILRHIYKCMTAVYIIWLLTMLLVSPLMILAPDFQRSTVLNLWIAAMLPVFAAALKRNKKLTTRLCILEYGIGYSIAIQLIVLLFFNFALPFIGIGDMRVMGVISLSIIAVLLSVSLLHNRLTAETLKARELFIVNQQAREYCRQVQDKYEAIMTVMHYLPKLYATLQAYIQKQDYDGLQAYFSKHIAPELDKYICEHSNLEDIEDEQLRNLVQITFGQIGMTMRYVTPELRIDGKIHIPQKLSMPVFEIMSNLIDNALQHIKYQRRGYLKMRFTPDDACLMISVTNSLAGHEAADSVFTGEATQPGCGYGLRRVRQIAVDAPQVELYTHKRGQFEGMPLLTQEIKIWLGDAVQDE